MAYSVQYWHQRAALTGRLGWSYITAVYIESKETEMKHLFQEPQGTELESLKLEAYITDLGSNLWQMVQCTSKVLSTLHYLHFTSHRNDILITDVDNYNNDNNDDMVVTLLKF